MAREPLKPLDIVDDRPRGISDETGRLLEAHLMECGPIVVKYGPNVGYTAASEWGEEDPSGYSPIVGGAAYGSGDTMAEALTRLVEHRR